MSPASAHEPSATLVIVSHDEASIVLDVRTPLEAYDIAYGSDLAADPAEVAASANPHLISQLEDTVSISYADGPSWTTSVSKLGTTEVDGAPNLSVRLTATPPTGVSAGKVELDWLFITGTFDSHKVFVVHAENVSTVLRAETFSPASILGLITAQDSVLAIERHLCNTFSHRLRTLPRGPGPPLVSVPCGARSRSAAPRLDQHGNTSRHADCGLHCRPLDQPGGHHSGPDQFSCRTDRTGRAVTILVTAVHAI